ncbi:unnamed protein product [Urochloa humidicola]
MRKDAVVAVLLVLMVTSGSATHAAARALPEELPAFPGGTTNNAPPPRTSWEQGRGLLPVEENKSGDRSRPFLWNFRPSLEMHFVLHGSKLRLVWYVQICKIY